MYANGKSVEFKNYTMFCSSELVVILELVTFKLVIFGLVPKQIRMSHFGMKINIFRPA